MPDNKFPRSIADIHLEVGIKEGDNCGQVLIRDPLRKGRWGKLGIDFIKTGGQYRMTEKAFRKAVKELKAEKAAWRRSHAT